MPRREGKNIAGRMETAGWKSLALLIPRVQEQTEQDSPKARCGDRVPPSPRQR